jgi:hypothetical protein
MLNIKTNKINKQKSPNTVYFSITQFGVFVGWPFLPNYDLGG